MACPRVPCPRQCPVDSLLTHPAPTRWLRRGAHLRSSENTQSCAFTAVSAGTGTPAPVDTLPLTASASCLMGPACLPSPVCLPPPPHHTPGLALLSRVCCRKPLLTWAQCSLPASLLVSQQPVLILLTSPLVTDTWSCFSDALCSPRSVRIGAAFGSVLRTECRACPRARHTLTERTVTEVLPCSEELRVCRPSVELSGGVIVST